MGDSINTNPARFYYVFNNRLAIIEKNGSTTVDNATTSYQSISEAKPLTIQAISKADHFPVGSSASSDDYSSTTIGPLGDIPSQFHEGLVYRAIAMGYKTPPSMDLQNAQYFEAEYEKVVKNAKKFSRRGYKQTAFIKPVEI